MFVSQQAMSGRQLSERATDPSSSSHAMGLTNAPATFQAFMNHIFRDMTDIFVVIYLDDILIFSNSQEEHQVHVQRVLDRLREYDLHSKPEKCLFHTQQIEFLGFMVTPLASLWTRPRPTLSVPG